MGGGAGGPRAGPIYIYIYIHIYIHIRTYMLFILSVYIYIHIDILLESYGHASEKTRTEAESKCHKWPKTNRSISLISARSPSCCQSWDTKPTM